MFRGLFTNTSKLAKFDVRRLVGKEKLAAEDVIRKLLSDHPVLVEPGAVMTWNVAGIAKCIFANKWKNMDPVIQGAGANTGIIVKHKKGEKIILPRSNPASDDYADKYEEKTIYEYPIHELDQPVLYLQRAKDSILHRIQLAKDNKVLFDLAQSYTCSAFSIAPDASKMTYAEVDAMYRSVGFTIANNPAKAITKEEDLLVQRYNDRKDAFIFIAYNMEKIAWVRPFHELANLISKRHSETGRLQAAVFRNKETNKEIVVLNVVQDWGIVSEYANKEERIKHGAVNDIKNVIDYCRNHGLECIVAGDFNCEPSLVKNIDQRDPLKVTLDANAEQAKWITGAENSVWDPLRQIKKTQTSCSDHIYLNESFRAQTLGEKLTQEFQVKTKL